MSTEAELLLERVKAATEDEYTIEGVLGRGGMAVVYLARDIALDRRVAIKVMLPNLSDTAEIQDRFVTEARTVAHLDHPNIVTVYSVKERAGLRCFVMKYIEGRTLDAVLKDPAPLDAPVVVEIVAQIAEALHFAHGEGIVHRDIKPSNIILDRRGRPVVTDFGIAKVASGRSLTMTGSMIGTPAYMSPEQCKGLTATSASDQYSLGVVAYEMLARRPPFEGSLWELIDAHGSRAPDPLSELVTGLDPALAGTVHRMLAKDPRERWPSMSDVVQRLTGGRSRGRRAPDVQATIQGLARDPAKTKSPRGDSAGEGTGGASDTDAGAGTTPTPGLVVSPAEPEIEVDEVLQLRVSESSGASLAGVRIRWKSEDPSVATVDDDGRVTGRGVGLAKITATAGAAVGRAAVSVREPRPDTLVVTPQSPRLTVDHELQFVATVLDARGKVVPAQDLVWTSSEVGVCAVSREGRAIGIAPGKATITAQLGSVSGTAQLRVLPQSVERIVVEPDEPSVEVDESVRLNATVYGHGDRRLLDRTVTWRSTVPGVLAVEPDGTVRGVSPGTAAAIATCEGKEGLASVRVRAQPAAAVRIQPARLELQLGRSIQLEGTVVDRRGDPIPGVGLEWESDDDDVALVDASGKVHGVSEGRTSVRAAAGDTDASIEVTVVSRPAGQVRIEAHSPTLGVGEFVGLDATVLDADGATVAGREVSWSSSDPAVVSVNEDGVCEGKRPGSARITAACEQVRATTKLSVSVPAPTVLAQPGVQWRPGGAASAGAASAGAASGTGAPRTLPAWVGGWRGVATAGTVLAAVLVGATWLALRPGSPDSPGAALAPTDTMVSPTDTMPDPSPFHEEGPAGEEVAAGVRSPAGTFPPDAAAADGDPSAAVPVPQQQREAPAEPPAGAVAAPVLPVPTPTVAERPVPEADRPADDPTDPPPAGAQAPIPAPAGDAAAEAERALLCENPTAAQRSLTNALASDPASGLERLYVPRGDADRQRKESLLGTIRGVQRLQASVRPIRNETTPDGCDWVMELELTWTNAFGQPRGTSGQVRLQLEAVDGTAHALRIFGLSGA